MNDDQLRDALRAIDAGTPVDWASVSPGADDDRSRSTLQNLEIVARVAAFHRALHVAAGIDSGGQGPDADAPTTADSLWGPLLLLERIGSGTFGDVFRAWDRRLDREVALKLLHRSSDSDWPDPGVVQEGRQMARVRHPNVVTVYGADVIEGRIGIWMECVSGRTLEDELRGGRSFSWRDSAAIGVAVCAALDAVHAAGLVHRDISARNVMRDEDGRIVVMDFGSARPSNETSVCGTPLYLAPELLAGQPASRTSDIYAVGVLLYRLVSGAYPVTGEDLGALREAHREGGRRSLRECCRGLPRAFADAVDVALDPDRTRRFQSAGDFGRALSSTMDTARPGRRWSSRHGASLTVAAAIAAVAAAVPVVQRGGQVPVVLDRTSTSEPAAALSPVVTRRVPLPDSPYPIRPSPDGRYVAFISLDGHLNLFERQTRRIRTLKARRGTAEFAYGTLAVSPDSRVVAYSWADANRRAALRVVNTENGEDRLVWQHEDGVDLQPVEWTGDGQALVAMGPNHDGTVQIAMIDARSGGRRVLKDGPFRPMGVSISPDGRFVVYDAPGGDQDRKRDIFLLDTQSGRDALFVTGPSNDLFPQWTPDGTAVIFASDRATTLGLWKVRMGRDATPGSPELVERDMGRMLPMGLTQDGSFYYFLKSDIVDVYSADLDPATLTVVGVPRPVAPERMGSSVTSDWSADGRYLAYVSIRGLVSVDRFSRALTICDLQTGQERDIWPAMAFFLSPRWSPDGRTILISGLGAENRGGIYAIDVASGRTSLVVAGQGVGEYEWSADGRSVLYRKGPSAIVAQDLATGIESVLLDLAQFGMDRLVARPGPPPPLMLRTFQLSPDGRRLAATAWSGNGSTMEASLVVREPGGQLRKMHTAPRLSLQGWTPDGNALLFTMPAEGSATRPSSTLWTIPSSGGVARPMGLELPGLAAIRPSPDGRRLSFTAGFDGGEIRVAERLLQRGLAAH